MLPWQEQINNDNLHLIAISNLDDNERSIIRWWCRKYRIPEKQLKEYTIEELFIEMMEDHYDRNPQEKDRFLAELDIKRQGEWNGMIEYDEKTKKRLNKFYNKNKVDISKWQSDKEMSDEEEKMMINALGKDLPGSVNKPDKKIDLIGGEEFEDQY